VCQLTHAIGIVGHVSRSDEAYALMAATGAVYMSLDNGNLGCSGNHFRVWRHLAERWAPHVGYLVVLEDDAVPCENFTDQLAAALALQFSPIVSLYLGRQRPPHLQYMIGPATKRADQRDASWIVSRHVLHAVGLAVRADLVADMLAHLDRELPIDDAIDEWANRHRYRVAYTWPSIVDHADGETLLKHPDGIAREPGRVAWKHGARDEWTYTQVEM